MSSSKVALWWGLPTSTKLPFKEEKVIMVQCICWILWAIHMVSFFGFFSPYWVWPRQPRLAPPSLLSGPTIPTNPPLCLTVRANNKTLGLKNSENSLLIPVFLHNFLELALNKTTATTVIVVRAVLHQVRISRQYESAQVPPSSDAHPRKPGPGLLPADRQGRSPFFALKYT